MTGVSPRPALHVLVAEDNVVNQRVAVSMLERRGHAVTIVDNGKAAIDALGSGEFDIVLMDVQMPGLSGLEATAIIRARERPGGRRTPIVAITARAMVGDRERCLAAGMDAYMAKPVRAAELYRVIEELAGARELPAATARTPHAVNGVLDAAALDAATAGDHELLVELEALFEAEARRLLAEIRSAVAAGDRKTLGEAAHCLKGSIASLGGLAAAAAAHAIELLARAGTMTGADDAVATLDAELARFVLSLGALARANSERRPLST